MEKNALFHTKYAITMETKDLTYLCKCIFVYPPFYTLDFFFLTQKLQNFHSLSCPGVSGEDNCEPSQTPPTLRSTVQCDTGDSPANEHCLEDLQPQTKEGEITRNMLSDPTIEEVDWNSTGCSSVTPGMTIGKDSEPLWAGLCSMRKDVYQLGGELDIEQIERN